MFFYFYLFNKIKKSLSLSLFLYWKLDISCDAMVETEEFCSWTV